MSIARRRLIVLIWLAAFFWWCWEGAAAWLSMRGYEDPAAYVSVFLVPGTMVGILGGLAALWKPNRWTLGVFGIISVTQIFLVVQKWP